MIRRLAWGLLVLKNIKLILEELLNQKVAQENKFSYFRHLFVFMVHCERKFCESH